MALPSAQATVRGAWTRLRRRKAMFVAAAAVAVPSALIGLAPGARTDGAVGVYAGFALTAMLIALAYMARRPAGPSNTVRSAYFEGTAPLVGVSLALVVLVGWAFAGVTVYAVMGFIRLGRRLRRRVAGPRQRALLVTAYAVVATIGAVAVALVNLAAWIVLGLGSEFALYYGAGYVIAAMIVAFGPVMVLAISHASLFQAFADGNARPLTGLRRARKLSGGQAWKLVGRLALLLGITLIVALLFSLLGLGTGLIVQYQLVPQSLFQALFGTFMLPYLTCYLTELYEAHYHAD